MRRLMVRTAKQSLYPKKIKYPIRIGKKGSGNTEVRRKIKDIKNKLSWRDAKRACKKIMKSRIKSKDSYFRLSCHPNSTLSVRSIQSVLQNWIRDDWVPDIVIIDYADILDMNYQGLEGRDRINETWKRLRSLSQIFHCLVVTGSQTDAGAYKKEVITRDNFSEDKRKLAHVTGMIGLNVTEKEKERGITRLNWVVLREKAFGVYKCVHVAGCLDVANPAIKSCW